MRFYEANISPSLNVIFFLQHSHHSSMLYHVIFFPLHFCWIPISLKKKEEGVPGCWSCTASRVLVSWESDPGPSPDAELLPGDGVPAFRLQEVL